MQDIIPEDDFVTEDEIRAMIRMASDDQSQEAEQINYREFVKIMLSK